MKANAWDLEKPTPKATLKSKEIEMVKPKETTSWSAYA